MVEINPVKPAAAGPGKVRKPPAGAKFLSLLDEMEASGQRLDVHAEVLVEELHETEKLAVKAVEARRTQNQQVRDYIERIHGVAEGLGDNGGPSLGEGSDESPKPSPEQLAALNGSQQDKTE